MSVRRKWKYSRYRSVTSFDVLCCLLLIWKEDDHCFCLLSIFICPPTWIVFFFSFFYLEYMHRFRWYDSTVGSVGSLARHRRFLKFENTKFEKFILLAKFGDLGDKIGLAFLDFAKFFAQNASTVLTASRLDIGQESWNIGKIAEERVMKKGERICLPLGEELSQDRVLGSWRAPVRSVPREISFGVHRLRGEPPRMLLWWHRNFATDRIRRAEVKGKTGHWTARCHLPRVHPRRRLPLRARAPAIACKILPFSSCSIADPTCVLFPVYDKRNVKIFRKFQF